MGKMEHHEQTGQLIEPISAGLRGGLAIGQCSPSKPSLATSPEACFVRPTSALGRKHHRPRARIQVSWLLDYIVFFAGWGSFRMPWSFNVFMNLPNCQVNFPLHYTYHVLGPQIRNELCSTLPLSDAFRFEAAVLILLNAARLRAACCSSLFPDQPWICGDILTHVKQRGLFRTLAHRKLVALGGEHTYAYFCLGLDRPFNPFAGSPLLQRLPSLPNGGARSQVFALYRFVPYRQSEGSNIKLMVCFCNHLGSM